MTIINIPADAPYYKGSGQAVLAVIGDTPIDAVYYSDPMAERLIQTTLEAIYPRCRTAAGMMSCYEFTPY